MKRQQILRVAVLAAIVEMSGMAVAQIAGDEPNQGERAKAPAGGGGGQAAQPPRQTGDRPSGGGNTTPPQAHPPHIILPPKPPGDPKGPVKPPAGDWRPPPGTVRDPAREPRRNPTDQPPTSRPVDGDRRHPQRPIVIVPVPGLDAWGPYTWWFSGNSYWWPPMDDYGR